jgi:DNA-binding NtrC family response regulator
MDSKQKVRVLIVDDDASLARTTALILSRKGYTVTTAVDGPEAIERVKENPFDVILMDIKMPLMDGVETYRRIKQVRTDCAVIMMTAFAVEELIQEALQEGAHGILYKPLDIEKMMALIDKAIRSQQGAFILLVDDDPATCTTLRGILAKSGYQVATAQTGEEAIAVTRQAAYDILFVDIKLPTINGLETYLAIKEINPEAVAVMMTAFRQEMADLVEAALSNDAYTCLYKPIDIEQLLRLVAEIAEKKASGKPLNAPVETAA